MGDKSGPGDEQQSSWEDDLIENLDAELEEGAERFLAQQGDEGASIDFTALGRELAGQMSLEEAAALIDSKSQSPPATLTRPPVAEEPAEVIALVSSLRTAVHAHFASVRLQDFLSRKRIRYVLVDINRDVAIGAGLRNIELVNEWEHLGLLQQNNEARLLVPQCLIDGCSVGDDVAVQDLEEDGDFDELVNRTACPACLGPRSDPGVPVTTCKHCQRLVGPLIPLDVYRGSEIRLVFNDRPTTWDEQLPPYNEKIAYKPVFRVNPIRSDPRDF